jgi:hypothetical protein
MVEAPFMRIQRKLLGLTIFSVLAIALLPASSGAVTIGNDLENSPSNGTCMAMMSSTTCTISQNTLNAADQASGGLVAPSAGVITKWRVRTSGANGFSLGLRVLDGGHSIVGEAPRALPAIEGIHGYDTRLPISAGNRIGLDIHADGGMGMMTVGIIYNTVDPDSLWDFWSPALADNSTVAPNGGQDDIGLLLNADIEPDADGDGYGDLTQDLCLANAAAHGACPLPPAPAVAAISLFKVTTGNKRFELTSSIAATATFTIEKKLKGRKSGKKCKTSAKTGKKCTVYKKAGSITAPVVAGINSIKFGGKVSGKKLSAGSYRVTAVATTPAGEKSSAISAAFKVR